jgi:peptide/nickel transport system permease protein
VKLLRFLFFRVLAGALTVLGVVTFCFLALHLLPGDPTDSLLGDTATDADREALRHALHLDRPLLTQYALFLRDAFLRGMGPSFTHPEHSALREVADVWPSTVALALCSAAVGWAVALPLALVASARPGSRTDAAVGVVSLAGVALPTLYTGPLLITLLCVTVPVLPFPGPDATGASSLVLPSLTLGAGLAGMLTRMGRASLREVLLEPYITAARARGLSEPAVLVRHALRSALVPLRTVGGAQLSALLGGALVPEKVFDRPGVGLLLLEALTRRDIPVVLAGVFVVAATAVVMQLLVDLAYAAVDPRIRVQ